MEILDSRFHGNDKTEKYWILVFTGITKQRDRIPVFTGITIREKYQILV